MINKIIKIALIGSTLVLSLGATDISKENKYFLGISTGISHISSEYSNLEGSFSNVTKPDRSGLNLALELGYKYDKSTFSTVSYNYIQFSDAKLHNYLVSYNKKLQDMPYNMYVGVVAGISYLDLTKSPVANLPITDGSGGKFAIGFQTGFEYKLSKDLRLFTQYQYLKAKHTTNITSGTARAETTRDNLSNLNFGIRWSFNSFGM